MSASLLFLCEGGKNSVGGLGRPEPGGGGEITLGRLERAPSGPAEPVGVKVLAAGFGLNSMALALKRIAEADVGLSTALST